MRSLLAPLLAGFLLLAGCSGGLEQPTDATTTDTPTLTTDGQGNVVPVENKTKPLETGEPVHIEETLDLTQPDSYSVAWDVKNGYRAFRVSVQVEGTNGAPLQGTTGLGYRLTGGTPVRTVADASGGQTSINGGTPGCAICFDAGAKDPDEMAGGWTLSVEWGPSAASARVSVEVLY